MHTTPYPLSKTVRRGIMIALIALFFIAAPLIILYTAGYRYSFDDFGIKKTGSLSVDVSPREARIYLDGIPLEKDLTLADITNVSKLTDVASASQTNLAEDDYTVRIELDGYLPWEKRTQVLENETTYIRDITLIPDTSAQERVLPEGVRIEGLTRDGLAFLGSAAQETTTTYGYYTLDDGEEITLFVGDEKEAFISYGYTHLVAKEPEDTQRVFFAEESTKTPREFVAKNPIPFGIPHNIETPLLWYTNEDGDIHTYALQSDQVIGTAPSSDIYYMMSASEGWFYDGKEQVLRREGGESVDIIELESAPQAIVHATAEYVVLKEKNSFVLYTKSEDTWIFERVPGMHFHFSEANFLFWTTSEIYHWTPGIPATLQYRTGKQISFVHPLGEEEELLIIEDGSMIVYDPRYVVTHTVLENVDSRALFSLVPEERLLRYITNGTLYERPLK